MNTAHRYALQKKLIKPDRLFYVFSRWLFISVICLSQKVLIFTEIILKTTKKVVEKIFSKEIAKIQFLQNICWCQDRQSYRRFLVKPNLRKLIPAKCSKKISEYLRGSFGKFWKLGMLCYSLKTLPNFEFSHHFWASSYQFSNLPKKIPQLCFLSI